MWAKQVWLKDGVLQTYDNSWKPIGPAPEPVAVTGVSLDESSLTLEIDETKKLTATITPSNATDKKVSWSSSDDAIATVSSDGTVRGVAGGSATITVTTHDGNFTATCGVTVSGGWTGVESVAFTNFASWASITGYAWQSEWTGIQVTPYTASNINVTVTSSNESVVSIGEIQYDMEPTEYSIGYVTWDYIGEWTATITLASVDNPSATSTITVTVESKVDVESISNISGLSFNVFPQTSIFEAITFEYSPTNATNPSQDIIFQLKEGETSIGGWQVQWNNWNWVVNFFTDYEAQVGDSAVYELFIAWEQASATEITVTVAQPIESVTNLDTTTMQLIEWGSAVTRSFDYTPIDAPVEDFFWADAGSNAQATVHKITNGQAYLEVIGIAEWNGTVTLKTRAGWGNYGQFDYVVSTPVAVESISNISVNNMWVGEGWTKTFTFDYLPANANDFSGISFVDSTYTSTSATYNSWTATVTVEWLDYTTTTSASVWIELNWASAWSVDVDVRPYANVDISPSWAGSVSPSVFYIPYGGITSSSDFTTNPCTIDIHPYASATIVDSVTLTATAESWYTFSAFADSIGTEWYDPSASRNGLHCWFNQNA